MKDRALTKPMASLRLAEQGRVANPNHSARLVRLDGGATLSVELEQAWREQLLAQGARGESSGPFLGPEVAVAVGRHSPDFGVLVGFEGERPTQFLPLHVGPRGRTRALGARFCDLNGPVGKIAPHELERLLQDVGLKSWRFWRNPRGGTLAPQHKWSQTQCRIVDLGDGLKDLRARRRAQGSRQIDQILRKERKLAREVGALRFEFRHSGKAVLDQLLEWKAEQRRRTGSVDVFSNPSARAALLDLHAARQGGALSALWAGDRLAAVHFGLFDTQTLHWWIPAYDRQLGGYSPGLILMLHLIRECAARGMGQIDLGHGEERYKAGLATSLVELHSGAVDPSAWRCKAGKARSKFREALRRSAFEPGWAATKRSVRKIRIFRSL